MEFIQIEFHLFCYPQPQAFSYLLVFIKFDILIGVSLKITQI